MYNKRVMEPTDTSQTSPPPEAASQQSARPIMDVSPPTTVKSAETAPAAASVIPTGAPTGQPVEPPDEKPAQSVSTKPKAAKPARHSTAGAIFLAVIVFVALTCVAYYAYSRGA